MVLQIYEWDYYIERYETDQHTRQRQQVAQSCLLPFTARSDTYALQVRAALWAAVIMNRNLGRTLATLRHCFPLLTVIQE